MWRVWAGVLLVVGCDGELSRPDGTWWIELDGACDAALTLDTHGGAYAHHMVCRGAGGVAEDEIEEGVLTVVRDGYFTIDPSRLSCPSHLPIYGTARFEVVADDLKLTFYPGGAETYSRMRRKSLPSGAVRYGCHEMEFIEHAIQSARF